MKQNKNMNGTPLKLNKKDKWKGKQSSKIDSKFHPAIKIKLKVFPYYSSCAILLNLFDWIEVFETGWYFNGITHPGSRSGQCPLKH